MEENYDIYVKALIMELAYHANSQCDARVSSIFFGGGTPSVLSSTNINNIIRATSEGYRLNNNIEITIESNPETLTLDKLKSYKSAGINRLSVGVQSFDDMALKYLGRNHTSKEARQAIHLARLADFPQLSADFMFGLPDQTIGQWQKELNRISALDLDHVSAYELTLEPGTPMWKDGNKIQKANTMAMFDLTESKLTKSGYNHYEISNYCKPQLHCSHNLGYWNYKNYIGIGASAHGFMNGKRYSNVKKIESYINRVMKSGKAIYKTETITNKKERIERLMLGLRLKNGIPLANIELTPKINDLINVNLLAISGKKLKATRKGWRILDSLLENI